LRTPGTDTPAGAVPPTRGELERIRLEAEAQMERSQRTVWAVRGVGVSVWALLVAWAAFSPRLPDHLQVIIGVALSLELGILAFALAIYSRRKQVRTAEENLERLHELAVRLEEASERDSLTGLYNHGYLLRRLQEEISHAQRHRRSLAVIILDLNEFKAVNDRHGHLVGDEVLQLIAGTIRHQVRAHDVVARYGGDEFCLVLPEADAEAAQHVVEKVRAAVAALSEQFREWTGDGIGFGVGICSYPADGLTVRALIAAADDRLYRDKHASRGDDDATAAEALELIGRRADVA
jgi:diguanylate cyclase (GGDEF)-like protein